MWGDVICIMWGDVLCIMWGDVLCIVWYRGVARGGGGRGTYVPGRQGTGAPK